MEANTVAPAPGLWRRVFRVIQMVEMSSGELQDLRIGALERRIIALEKALRGPAAASSDASATAIRPPS